jgi:hypothetical protein
MSNTIQTFSARSQGVGFAPDQGILACRLDFNFEERGANCRLEKRSRPDQQKGG